MFGPMPKAEKTAGESRSSLAGRRLPKFSLPGVDANGEDVTVSSELLLGKWAIIYFYPRDATPGCTRQAEGFRDARTQLKRLNATVVGISKDSIESHCKFREKFGLNFALATDADTKVMQAFGAWGEKTNYGKTSLGVIRTTVIVDPEGKVHRVFPKVKVDGHVDAVLREIEAASAS